MLSAALWARYRAASSCPIAPGGVRGDQSSKNGEFEFDPRFARSAFLRHLVDRGLKGVELITSDACRGLVESAAEFLPDARWQRCVVLFYAPSSALCLAGPVRGVSHMSRLILAQETRATAEPMAEAVVEVHRRQRMGRAADLVDAHVREP